MTPEEAPHTWRPARFMLIAAHPDDADFGPAATAARWISEGSVGWLVCCTSGDAGGEDPDIDPLELAAVREREQRAAADIVGYEGVTFLHQPDHAPQGSAVAVSVSGRRQGSPWTGGPTYPPWMASRAMR